MNYNFFLLNLGPKLLVVQMRVSSHQKYKKEKEKMVSFLVIE